jgi:hypothetical protein
MTKERLVALVRELDLATNGGRGPLSNDAMVEVCAIATPFKTYSHRWRTGDDGGDELEIYNMDTGPDANPASGARFYPRADHDTDAAIDLLGKIVPEPYRLDLTILEGREHHMLNSNPMARLQKTIDGTLYDLSCQSEALPLAILGVALKAVAVCQACEASPLVEVLEGLPPMDDLPPPDSEDQLPTFEGLPE